MNLLNKPPTSSVIKPSHQDHIYIYRERDRDRDRDIEENIFRQPVIVKPNFI